MRSLQQVYILSVVSKASRLNETYRVTVVVQVSLTFVELIVIWDADSTLDFTLDA